MLENENKFICLYVKIQVKWLKMEKFRQKKKKEEKYFENTSEQVELFMCGN